MWRTNLYDEHPGGAKRDSEVSRLQTVHLRALLGICNILANPQRNPEVSPCISRSTKDDEISVWQCSLLAETSLLQAHEQSFGRHKLFLKKLSLSYYPHALTAIPARRALM